MRKYKEEDVDRLKSNAQIQKTIYYLTGQNVSRGKNFSCINPEHNDKKPSMGIIPHKEVCHCFTCGYTADSLKLIQDLRNVSFLEAIEILAEIEGNPSWFQPQEKERKQRAKRPQLWLTKEELELIHLHVPGLVSVEKSFCWEKNDGDGSFIPSGDSIWKIYQENERTSMSDFCSNLLYANIVKQKSQERLYEVTNKANHIKQLTDSQFTMQYEITAEFLSFYNSSIARIRRAMVNLLREEYTTIAKIIEKVDDFLEKLRIWEEKTPDFLKS